MQWNSKNKMNKIFFTCLIVDYIPPIQYKYNQLFYFLYISYYIYDTLKCWLKVETNKKYIVNRKLTKKIGNKNNVEYHFLSRPVVIMKRKIHTWPNFKTYLWWMGLSLPLNHTRSTDGYNNFDIYIFFVERTLYIPLP